MSIILMLLGLLVLVAVLGGIVAGIVVLVSRKSKSSTVDVAPGVGGWYPDPQDTNVDRYHDGQTWTAHTRPRVDPAR
ncbi:DUF2510 domain-containing protein [Gordonia hongkongensis]|uniref:DUF2510 domain-containing protein n=1 Tax=Gordonia hongkongensis TaxID=1701090 RepID=UPI0030D1B3C8